MIKKYVEEFNKEELLKLNEYGVFKFCCKNGYFEIVKWIYNIRKDYKMIEANNYSGFTHAYYNGNFEIVKWLYNLKKDYKMIEARNYLGFRWTCYYGYFEIVKWVYNLKKDYKMIETSNYEGFRVVCRYGYFEIIKWMYNLCLEFLKDNKCYFKNLKDIDIAYFVKGEILNYKEISDLKNIKSINNEIGVKPGGLLSICVLKKYIGFNKKTNLYY